MMLSETPVLQRSSFRLLVAAGLAGVLTLALLTTADAASHREAPLIMEDPVADNTDVYAFVSPDKPTHTTLQANFVPFQEPGGGPNYFRFGEDVLYEIKVDNDADAVEDVSYQFRFRNDIQDPNNYLYATGPIESLEDQDYNFRQSMDVFVVRNGERTRIGSDLTLPPVNAGPRSTPNYNELAAEGVHDLAGGVKVFAGQRDDGFYADIASIFDLGGLRPFNEAHAVEQPTADGIDTFAGYNVHNISIQVPTATLTKGDNPNIGVYSTASRRKVRVFQQNDSSKAANRGRWIQVSRLGMPLVNEVVLPLAVKDVFNGLDPANDAAALSGLETPSDTHGAATKGPIPLVTDPILAAQIKALYGVDVPPAPRDDLVAVFLTGVEGLNQTEGGQPSEMLRLNTSIEPKASLADGDSLGVIAGDNAGFPNGRRPGDDVIDASLRVVAGVLVDGFNKEPNNQLTDGVQNNDKPFLEAFPYLATPHQGYDLNNPARVPAPQG